MRQVSLGIGAAILVIDLATKWFVKTYYLSVSYPILDGFFEIQYVENTGIAFGFLDSLESEWKAPMLGSLAVLAAVMVIYYIWITPQRERSSLVALGLILGGVMGNFIDRLLHTFVIDFIRIHWRELMAWPTFNVADSAITSGVILFFVLNILEAFKSKSAVGERRNL
jgi:signal peptidase II